MLRMWAIRERETNNYLPALTKNHKRGHSFQIPCDATHHQPRFFLTRLSAECALRAWLRGEFHTTITGGRSYFGEDEYKEYTEVKPVPDRKREKMELVEFELHEIER